MHLDGCFMLFYIFGHPNAKQAYQERPVTAWQKSMPGHPQKQLERKL
jgi:hypothetical protein